MFENKEKTPLDQIGEFGLIRHLTKDGKSNLTSTVIGNGDDAAVVKHPKTVISTDMLVEQVHFDMMYTPLKHLGYKAIVVSISDICAMNADPKQVMVAISISSKYTLEAIEELYAGIYAACDKYKVDLIGGDTSTCPQGMTITVTSIGALSDKEDAISRSGAKPGDLLCVSGDLGGAYAGLQLLEREKRIYLEQNDMQPDLEGYDYVIGRQLRPEARTDIKETLAGLKVKPTAMLDISDGLASETLHLCRESNVGIKLHEDKIPMDPQTVDIAKKFQLNPSLFALSGGEDYELLFTIPQSDYPKIENNMDISVVGYCTEPEEGKIFITGSGNEHPLTAQGWDGFSA